jgi:hypothetical protein
MALLIIAYGCTPSKSLTVDKVIYSKIAGVTFDNCDGTNRQALLPSLKKGDELELKREQNNAFDNNAVAIYSPKGQIGYINAELAPYISTIIDNDGSLRVIVNEITGGEPNQYYGCNIEIMIYKRAGSNSN